MYDIFLSYSTKDRERLEPLFHALEQQGWLVFWDHRTIGIGEHWNRKIDRAIRTCTCVVVVWSAASVDSDWVLDEANIGRQRNILLPIQLEDVSIPVGFTMRQTGNFMGWNGKADHPEFVRLCNQIRTFIGEETVAPAASSTIVAQPPKPVWASAIGDDQYGHYADLNLKGVIQRFRQIKPGTFLMGSPLLEVGRGDGEIPHPVTLTQVFWLADTACTQAFWQAVMGSNPAYFTDNANNPVEQVSWNDVQDFTRKLNGLMAGLRARLPTEAEWEYACRAGTQTPFFFGDNITPEQVNYNGNYPYANGKTGLYRQKTVPVKSLPANSWGLYEMHGNVWEWCQDWFGSYPAQPVTDPQGLQSGTDRVLHGGSWIEHGGYCRSADRDRHVPARRSNLIGFRLSLGC